MGKYEVGVVGEWASMGTPPRSGGYSIYKSVAFTKPPSVATPHTPQNRAYA
jgi:hypothetical protein